MTRLTANSTVILAVFAAVSLLALVAVENSRVDVRQRWYAEKLAAAQKAAQAAERIRSARLEKGIFVDLVNDPNRTMLIGQEYTPITTDRGYIDAKLATTNPNCAAVVVDLLKESGVKERDYVAVAMTGSFPGLNIAVFSALETLRLRGIVITSVGSSNWGANDPYFTWLDMERLLAEAGVFGTRSGAASIGGGGDVGRGLSPEGRALIVQAIKRTNVEFINEDHLEHSVERRLKLYEKHSKGNPIKAYINVGGGIASLGTAVNGEIIPTGLSMQLAVKNYPVRGVIIEMARRNIPIIHLYNIRQLWTQYDLPLNPVPMPEPGSGGVFVHEKYDVAVAATLTGVLTAIILTAAYIDRRRHKLGIERLAAAPGDSNDEM